MAKNRIRKPASPNRTPGLTAIAEARIHMLENCKRKKLLNKLDMRGNLFMGNEFLTFLSVVGSLQVLTDSQSYDTVTAVEKPTVDIRQQTKETSKYT